MKTLKKIVFTGLLALIACAGVAQAQELYKDEKAPMHERIMDLLSRLTVEEKISLLRATSYKTQNKLSVNYKTFCTDFTSINIKQNVNLEYKNKYFYICN